MLISVNQFKSASNPEKVESLVKSRPEKEMNADSAVRKSESQNVRMSVLLKVIGHLQKISANTSGVSETLCNSALCR